MLEMEFILDTDGCEACQTKAKRIIDRYSGNRWLACLVAIFELDGWYDRQTSLIQLAGSFGRHPVSTIGRYCTGGRASQYCWTEDSELGSGTK